ncbi:MAG: membrane protein insertase YidC [Candidatus Latescibacteria bacterium]|nr:membrane protein insertase YidC [Candidatus Latescibacterota bacterium]
MDKNFLIAILITVGIIFIYSSPWYQKKFGTELPPETIVESTQSDSLQSSASSEKKSEQVIRQNTPEKTIVVHDPMGIYQINVPEEKHIILKNAEITIEISSHGGSIIKATMNMFDGLSNEESAQLVTENKSWCNGRIIDNDTDISFTDIIFDIKNKSDKHLTLTAELSNNATITREYTLDESGYMIQETTALDGTWNDPELTYVWDGPINMTETPPKQLRIWPFTMFMRDETDLYNKISYLGQGDRTTIEIGGKEKTKRIYSKEGAQKINIKKDKGAQDIFDGDLDWYAIRSKYFMTAAIPLQNTRWKAISRSDMDGLQKSLDFAISKRLSDGDTSLKIYCGPISYDLLKSYNYNLPEIMELSWRFIRPLSIAFLWSIKKIQKIIPNWGLVIIIFSVLIKVVLYPLSKSSIESMRKMSNLQPQINELKEKHKNNPQKQHLAMMELYKKEGINPMGGCLPMLLQMPVFFALYPVVGRAFELRQAMFIPHWIEDLSRPDPFYILPVAMGISMFFQSKTTMKDPNQKAMLYVMPVMMIILFANFSSGLTLYWFMFNIMTYVQQEAVKPRH